HETRIEIERPIEAIWRAITEASELARWFAPKMTVEPGVGGFVLADWGPGIEWKTLIEVWEPNRHLRLVENRDHLFTPPGIEQKFESRKLVQDYFLEAKDGKTILRLVHSGFGTSAGWDEEFDGTRGGWAGCFVRLKHSLEEHRGESVHNRIFTRICAGMDAVEVLRRIEGAAPADMRVEQKFDRHVCGVVPSWNGSIFNASASKVDAGAVAYVELLMYGFSDERAAGVESEWKATLASLFPDPAKV
ncbi:MAG: SRPBCC domain-containing protein, partial [Bryobacteraceae bacterium]